ncbi:hypothetical protein [Streptomyces sp. WAC04114]|uniref:hypothetical protein n=1 Tax=Streptomyces sp. WAC04114 TaxID=2867961 RepID=UPI001C8C91D4|nr:hypothetical protein [Streptomyces sp. WAC04114]MBX9364913.1 hypothetical protein [Streptomyces sp. WAC04114]
MPKKLRTLMAASAALLAATAAALSPAAEASAATPPPSVPRVSVHFDLAKGQTPENIALAPNGDAYVTFAAGRQVAKVSRDGTTRILATLPEPADGGTRTPVLGFPLTVGIVRAHDGTLYFLYATGTPDLTGVWRLRPGGKPQRIAALPANGLPNGLALDTRTRMLYITDSVLGTISRVPITGGTPAVWSAAPELASTGFLGVNGLKIHNGAVWATNLDKGTILRIPIRPDGRAGRLRTEATGLPGIDDFAFTGRGEQLLATLNGTSRVALVEPDGGHSIVLTQADGLQNPTSVAVRAGTVYVTSAAYLTAEDPNLIRFRLRS